MASKTTWEAGARIGRATLLANLAAGGMAEIWLARQGGVAGFEKLVVIKRMIGALRDDPEHVQMFLAEARLAATLSHRNIVQVYELGEEGGSFFIVMEFIEGESLARIGKELRARNELMPPHLAVQLVAWAAEALHYAHTVVDGEGKPRGVIHRDVSPQNLLVTADGSIKVVDFGIAKLVDEDTRSGKLKGKIAYMPPEQARADPLDARADVFSLGVVLFELLTNTRLFGKIEELELLKILINERPLPKLRERLPALDERLEAIVARAMSPARDGRHATAAELQNELEAWLGTTGQRPNANAVSTWLTSLFPNRIAERRAALEAARQGRDISKNSSALLAGSGSSSGANSGSRATPSPEGVDAATGVDVTLDSTKALGHAATPRKRGVPLVLAALLVLGGGLTWWWSANRPPDPTTVPPPPVSTPPSSIGLEANVGSEVMLDGRVIGQTPLVFDVEPGNHELRFASPGYEPETKPIVVQPGKRLKLSIVLHAVVAVVPDAGEPKSEVRQPPVSVARGTGKLNLKTSPWTTVYLGKKKLGETPLVGLSLPAGSHVLRLENAESGIKSSVEVVIKPNETTTESLSLK